MIPLVNLFGFTYCVSIWWRVQILYTCLVLYLYLYIIFKINKSVDVFENFFTHTCSMNDSIKITETYFRNIIVNHCIL